MRKTTIAIPLGLGVLVTALAIGAYQWSTGQIETTPQPGLETQVAIYQAVIRQLYGPDDTFGGQLAKPRLYIVRNTNDAASDPTRPTSIPATLPDATEQGITAALADLPTHIIWVDRFTDVSREKDTGRVSGGGVIIQLGNITFEHSDKALVSASIYIASLAAGGTTYIVEKQNNSWTVTGTNGVQWIS